VRVQARLKMPSAMTSASSGHRPGGENDDHGAPHQQVAGQVGSEHQGCRHGNIARTHQALVRCRNSVAARTITQPRTIHDLPREWKVRLQQGVETPSVTFAMVVKHGRIHQPVLPPVSG